LVQVRNRQTNSTSICCLIWAMTETPWSLEEHLLRWPCEGKPPLPDHMMRDQMAFALTQHYESVLANMEVAMDQTHIADVHALKLEMTLCMHSMHRLGCISEVSHLLQRGQYHEEARRTIAERFQREFSLLQPLRGGGSATSVCRSKDSSSSSSVQAGADSDFARSVTPPPKRISKIDAERFVNHVQGKPLENRDCCCFCCNRLEIDEEDDWTWSDIPGGPQGWSLLLHHLVNSSHGGALLSIANMLSFGVEMLDAFSSEAAGLRIGARVAEIATVTVLLLAACLGGAFDSRGIWEHFNNGVNDVDLGMLALSWITQVVVSPDVSSVQAKLVLMAPPTVLRVLKVVRLVWRWCCGRGDEPQSDAKPPVVYGTV